MGLREFTSRRQRKFRVRIPLVIYWKYRKEKYYVKTCRVWRTFTDRSIGVGCWYISIGLDFTRMEINEINVLKKEEVALR